MLAAIRSGNFVTRLARSVSLASNLAYMLVLLGVGVAGRRADVLSSERTELLSRYAFYVALPAVVFVSTYGRSLDDVLSARLVGGALAVLLAFAGASWLVHRRLSPDAARSVAVVQSYHGNLGFLGLPIVAASYGGLAAAKAGLLLGVLSLVQTPLTVAFLVGLNGGDRDLAGALRDGLTNPALAALVVGLAASTFGVPVPDVGVRGLSLLGVTALPSALLSVGASLAAAGGASDAIPTATVGRVVGLKVVAMPLVALALFTVIGASPSTVQAGVTMLAMPCAVSTFVLASELGGDDALASVDLVATTVASFAVVFALARLL